MTDFGRRCGMTVSKINFRFYHYRPSILTKSQHYVRRINVWCIWFDLLYSIASQRAFTHSRKSNVKLIRRTFNFAKSSSVLSFSANVCTLIGQVQPQKNRLGPFIFPLLRLEQQQYTQSTHSTRKKNCQHLRLIVFTWWIERELKS